MIVKGKKRPRVPRDLVAMFWRIKYHGGIQKEYFSHIEARWDAYKERECGPVKLYRVTVWRKR